MAIWISHRGESHDAPENTASAFRLAMERDVDGMETDIHLTSDNVLVCSHDANTQRCCGGVSMVIEQSTFEEVEKLDACNGKIAFQGEKIPTFSEALEILKPGKLFYVEIKENDPRVIDAMMAEIDKSHCTRDQIIMISFHADIVKLFKEKYPKQQALWLTSFKKNEDGTFIHDKEFYLKKLQDLKCDGVDAHCNAEFVDAEFVKMIHDAGMFYTAWTLDTVEICQHFLDIGIDSVTSNCAAKMRDAIEK